MGVEEIANKYKTTQTQPDTVWANNEMDELRRKECLCLGCGQKDIKDETGRPYANCAVARQIYDTIAQPHDMAMMITRCGATDDDGKLLYLPSIPKTNDKQMTFEF